MDKSEVQLFASGCCYIIALLLLCVAGGVWLGAGFGFAAGAFVFLGLGLLFGWAK